jgi:hypothetical protein
MAPPFLRLTVSLHKETGAIFKIAPTVAHSASR